MWTYVQKTGELLRDGRHEAFGYAGFDDPISAQQGKNNPDLQTVHEVGPIPIDKYSIGGHEDTLKHGPCVLPLTPDPANQMFGRDGFLIHGDSKHETGTASRGCIIMDGPVRNDIAESGDRSLEVISGEVDETRSA